MVSIVIASMTKAIEMNLGNREQPDEFKVGSHEEGKNLSNSHLEKKLRRKVWLLLLRKFKEIYS